MIVACLAVVRGLFTQQGRSRRAKQAKGIFNHMPLVRRKPERSTRCDNDTKLPSENAYETDEYRERSSASSQEGILPFGGVRDAWNDRGMASSNEHTIGIAG